MRQLIVETGTFYNKTALLEDGVLQDLWVEPLEGHSLVGRIYKGRVERVVPGLEAAFVSIGLEQAGYLGVKDCISSSGERSRDISTLIKGGQEILVQVLKDSRQDKGVQLTTKITLPGRYLVLTPMEPGLLLSKKITDPQRRSELIETLKSWLPEGCGVLIRTEGANVEVSLLKEELDSMLLLWKRILPYRVLGAAPQLIYKESSQGVRFIRQLGAQSLDVVQTNTLENAQEIAEALGRYAPGYSVKNVVLSEEILNPLIQEALNPFVPLAEGGFLWIETTKALTVIDVNSGSRVGERCAQDNFLKVNLDAVQEIARQIRIRNLGGILLIDFIDLKSSESRKRIVEALSEVFAKDRMPISILGFTRLGLLEMTRKVAQPPLEEVATQECPYCQGSGRVESEGILLERLHRELERIKVHTTTKALVLEAGSELYQVLKKGALGGVKGLGRRYGIQISIESIEGLWGFRILK